MHAVPWKTCCSLAPEDSGYDSEKKKIERRFTGHTKLSWKDIDCYLNKLPEPTREHATTAAFCLFKRWCEGTRTGRTAGAREEARDALATAEAATAGRQWPPVTWLWLTDDAVSSTPPIMMTPGVATDQVVATSAPDGHSFATLVPRADLEQVEHQLAIALERAREAGDRAQAAEDQLTAITLEREGSERLRGELCADIRDIGVRLIQTKENLAAARVTIAQAGDLEARAARVDDRERAVQKLEIQTIARISEAENRAQQAEQLSVQLSAHAAHLSQRVAFLEEQNQSFPVPRTPTETGQPTAETGVARRRWRRPDRRQDEVSGHLADENRRARVRDQASLTAQLEETDRLRRDLVDTVAHEFHEPLTEIRDALTAARDAQPTASPLTDRLTAAVHTTDQIERLLDSLVAATTVAHTDIHASDLTLALADLQHHLTNTHRHGDDAVIIDAPAHLPVRMDGHTLQQLLANLADDALRTAAPGSPVHIGAGRIGDRILLRIRTRAFTSQPDEGTSATSPMAGIRYVIEQIVNAHEGHLRVDTHYANGVYDILDVELPAADLLPSAQTIYHPPRQAPATPTPAPTDDHTPRTAVPSS